METTLYRPDIAESTGHIFDEDIRLTGITEYGVGWEDLTSGNAAIPPQGARFDLAFEGKVIGTDVNGVIKGVDYLTVRGDGKFMLDIRARIITDDGELIAVKENGISTPEPGGIAKLHLNLEFFTVSDRYNWLNKKQAWVVGDVNMLNGEVKVSGYSN
jgi:hypothetical protein